MKLIKRKYEVRWYDLDLTQELRRRFFTDFAASFFAWWLEYKYNECPKIYKYE